jgi:hypothetical protein
VFDHRGGLGDAGFGGRLIGSGAFEILRGPGFQGEQPLGTLACRAREAQGRLPLRQLGVGLREIGALRRRLFALEARRAPALETRNRRCWR